MDLLTYQFPYLFAILAWEVILVSKANQIKEKFLQGHVHKAYILLEEFRGKLHTASTYQKDEDWSDSGRIGSET